MGSNVGGTCLLYRRFEYLLLYILYLLFTAFKCEGCIYDIYVYFGLRVVYRVFMFEGSM